ncbi:hypothetical protein [Streptomyces erythrochromogenes]|uniref:hypothetical protein n=1 Tax=Streptomyces erythrochromogenes TaxID=285574 RepID=UPI00369622F3
MPLPTTRVVTGHYVNPATGANATGRVVLTPYPGVWTDETNDQVLTGQGTVTLVGGAFSQALVTTDAAGVEPATGRLWILEERIDGRPYRRRAFALNAGVGSVDITDLVEADPGNVTYIRTPTAHAASHASDGTDPVTPASIGAETPAAAQAKANAAQAAAEATAAGALSAHTADTTGVHGIADTSALETTAGATAKVTAHAAASDPHGDRAWATGQFYPLSSGNALNGYLDDALLRITDLETRMTNVEAETRSVAKTADEPVTNNTLQDDNELLISVVAQGWYEIAMYIDTEGDPAADLTMGWSVPAGAALSWTESGVSAGNTNNIGSIKLQRNDAATASGVGIIAAGSVVLLRGVLRVASTGGTLQFRWAQTSTNATPTIIKTGSVLKLTRVA